MAKGIREIKRQIKSVQNTRQITKAMEMVASAKLRKAQEKAQASRPYVDKLREVVSSIAAGTTETENMHPMLVSRPVKRTAYIVITSDGGLVGGYNANLLRAVMDQIKAKHTSPEEYGLFVIGRKGRDYFNRRNMPVVQSVTELSDSPKFSDIKSLAYSAVQGFELEQYDEIYTCYSKFINAISQKPTIDRLLPFDQVEYDGPAAEYEYEPSPAGVLEVLLPKYAETLIFSALLEGKASELGAKMTAMGSATKNATEMINQLTLTYNRARQAAITQEITEIVAGANAQS